MPITPPETIRDMSAVFVDICEALQLKVGDDPATRIVAERIIEHAQRGVRDVATLRATVLKEFDVDQ